MSWCCSRRGTKVEKERRQWGRCATTCRPGAGDTPGSSRLALWHTVGRMSRVSKCTRRAAGKGRPVAPTARHSEPAGCPHPGGMTLIPCSWTHVVVHRVAHGTRGQGVRQRGRGTRGKRLPARYSTEASCAHGAAHPALRHCRLGRRGRRLQEGETMGWWLPLYTPPSLLGPPAARPRPPPWSAPPPSFLQPSRSPPPSAPTRICPSSRTPAREATLPVSSSRIRPPEISVSAVQTHVCPELCGAALHCLLGGWCCLC